ncbi:unnamed protein product [Bemisia tabaci]|uniref:Suppressor APC domain-containing protein n=1 Tax=Bemisia tabaci TaxID=7038 RepID=A0A9P0AG11_BEMTA|nr:unnamed protein product [Bemisia tabaci]
MPPTFSQNSAVDGLPKQFVIAMRTLFDIMDDKHVGYVKFSEIERRWQDDGTKGLPPGVLESLRKVTPVNGLLTFERFCAGLKICLLKNQVEGRNQQHDLNHMSKLNRPPSAPILDLDSNKLKWESSSSANLAPSVFPTQRTSSMPQLPGEPPIGIPIIKPPLYGPPKPPRTAVGLERGMQLAGTTDRAMDKAEIRTVLQNWQLGLMMNEEDKRLDYNARTRSVGDGKPTTLPAEVPITSQQHKKQSGRRKEPRRHTLQNGIDYNMLKRMKQIEQERDVLMQGLRAVEQARDWYLKQIVAVQEKMKYLGREQWSEAQQERIELQTARVLEVNRHLAALTDGSGLPIHMNLAYPATPHLLNRLKHQNNLLNEEVTQKSERITLLEREKASLIRELFQVRSQSRRSDVPSDQVGFM